MTIYLRPFIETCFKMIAVSGITYFFVLRSVSKENEEIAAKVHQDTIQFFKNLLNKPKEEKTDE